MKKNFTLLEKIFAMRIRKIKAPSEHIDYEDSVENSEPSEYVLNNIFNYSKAMTVIKLQKTRDYNLVLN